MTNDKPQFSRTPGGMSVRAIIKAKDVKRTPEEPEARSDEYFVRSHAFGMLQSLVKICLDVDEDSTRRLLRRLVFDGVK